MVITTSDGPEGVVHFYNGRGSAERWIEDGNYTLNGMRLSCHRFVANQVQLDLFILADNLGNFLCRLCLPKAVNHWSLLRVQIKLIKIGASWGATPGAWCSNSLNDVPRDIFRQALERIGELYTAPG